MSWSNRAPLPFVLIGLLVGSPVHGQASRDTLAVFFLGNSYTYFNNLPGLVEAISEGLDGPQLTTWSHTHPGYRLREHLDDGHLPDAFGEGGANGDWDVVVLQEQSALAAGIDTLTGKIGSPDGFREAVRELDTVVRRFGAMPALYMTWAKKRWPDQIGDLAGAYRGIGAEVGAPVAPVGAAWAAARAERPDLDLYVADGSHPNPAGSYLAACVLYATLTGRSPVGAPREVWGATWNGRGLFESDSPTLLVSLSPDDAEFLQELAWKVVSTEGPAEAGRGLQ